jgi:hypothetical protein
LSRGQNGFGGVDATIAGPCSLFEGDGGERRE